MLNVVIDTSSLISYALTHGDIMTKIVQAWEDGEILPIFSPDTHGELLDVLARPYLAARSGRARNFILEKIEKQSFFVQRTVSIAGVCRDPNDEKFLVCAVVGKAHYLVSSDKDLLDLKQYEGICIVDHGTFLIALRLAKLTAAEMKATFSQEALQTIQENVCLEPETAVSLTTALSS